MSQLDDAEPRTQFNDGAALIDAEISTQFPGDPDDTCVDQDSEVWDEVLDPADLSIDPTHVNSNQEGLRATAGLSAVAESSHPPASDASPPPNDQLGVNEPEIRLLEPPPLLRNFNSAQEAIDFVQSFTRPRGYAVSKHNVRRSRKTGEIIRYELRCTKSKYSADKRKIPASQRKRHNRGSAKTSCPFAIKVRFAPSESTWCIDEMGSLVHNHPADSSMFPNALHRRRDQQDADIDAIIAREYWNGLLPGQTLNNIRASHPDTSITITDVYNKRQAIKNSAIGTKTVAEATVERLHRKGFFVRYDSTESTIP